MTAFGNGSMRMKLHRALPAAFVWAFSPSFSHAQADCGEWPDLLFFAMASPVDVERCLAGGADIGARTEGGLTPLHAAVTVGTEETVGALLAGGADTEDRGESSFIPLHLALIVGSVERVGALLAGGADIGARAEFGGWTPLHFAAAFGTAEMVEALLDAGADARTRDRFDRTPFDRAESNEKLAGTHAHWLLSTSTTATAQVPADGCRIEDWKHSYLGQALFIEGVTTCEAGRLYLRLYDGEGDTRRFVGVEMEYIEGHIFEAMISPTAKPDALSIQYTIDVE